MTQPKFKRPLDRGDFGSDVEGVGRALAATGLFQKLSVFHSLPYATRRTWGWWHRYAVNRLKKKQGWTQDGRYDQRTHAHLVKWEKFDARATALVNSYDTQTPAERAFEKLLASMKQMSDHTPGYLLGGGHGIPLDEISPYQRLDCSSSTSKALYDAGLFEGHEYAIVSGLFETWGAPGPGAMFSVYYNAEHVWIRTFDGPWWRFDTSPHGDGGRGPKLRKLPRFTGGFAIRHFPGM